jgi:hypothetical protein
MKDLILRATVRALRSVNRARFFQTERGYHGAFYHELHVALDALGVLSEEVILEIEYQKSDRHGTHQRPDIILHTPAELHNTPVNVGNLAVFALKRRASRREAMADFDKLDDMFHNLEYPLGVFINVDSPAHHLRSYEGEYKGRLHSFGVRSAGETVTIIHAHWAEEKVIENRE